MHRGTQLLLACRCRKEGLDRAARAFRSARTNQEPEPRAGQDRPGPGMASLAAGLPRFGRRSVEGARLRPLGPRPARRRRCGPGQALPRPLSCCLPLGRRRHVPCRLRCSKAAPQAAVPAKLRAFSQRWAVRTALAVLPRQCPLSGRAVADTGLGSIRDPGAGRLRMLRLSSRLRSSPGGRPGPGLTRLLS